ncbi:MAG: 5,6-dimethylbenzimidazole synthase [Paracoccaceae bacterium]|nr:5,6-dimethylbenzimidazole synthase [Paracoccaceae bacterium]MDG2258716.1 5,6-dimethylbenzimidazole synthase [Paracoccaceae bacterium]
MQQGQANPEFGSEFREQLDLLLARRRDVRRFRTDPVDEELLQSCLSSFAKAPSVGLSEPWRVVRISSDAAKNAALMNFQSANNDALNGYSGEKAKTYAGLKLSGMQDAPVQIAVFCDEETEKGAGLGAGTMPEMRRYSCVSAIMQFWLVLRAHGLGLGWVSILDPDKMHADLNIPSSWSLVAYLCIGWPEDFTDTPELELAGWETRAETLEYEER